MKSKILFFFFIAFAISINAQGVFNWNSSTNKPSAVAWTPDGSPQGFSDLYRYGNGTGTYPYYMMIGADAINTFNIHVGEGAYVKFFIPPGIGEIGFGYNDESLAGSQCVKHSFVGEYDLNYTVPSQSSGSESWTWGCGAFNKTYTRPTQNIGNETILIIGYYNEDNNFASGINFQDFSFTYKIKDTILYNAWINGITCDQNITSGSIGGSQVICDGEDPALYTSTSPATGNSDLIYQWQYSADATNWTNFDQSFNPNEPTLDLPAVNFGVVSTTVFFARRQASDCSGVAISNIQTLTVEVCNVVQENVVPTVKMYPNPVTEILTIESNGQMNYEIVDLLGKSVLIGQAKHGKNQINITNLSSGKYFLKFDTLVYKIIKE